MIQIFFWEVLIQILGNGQFLNDVNNIFNSLFCLEKIRKLILYFIQLQRLLLKDVIFFFIFFILIFFHIPIFHIFIFFFKLLIFQIQIGDFRQLCLHQLCHIFIILSQQLRNILKLKISLLYSFEFTFHLILTCIRSC